MRLAVIGGKLQGTEAGYLAAKAGYETVLVDRKPAPPAAGLVDATSVSDVTAERARTETLLHELRRRAAGLRGRCHSGVANARTCRPGASRSCSTSRPTA